MMNSFLAELKMDVTLDQFKDWELKPGHAKVWTFDLFADDLELNELERCLSIDELVRAEGFKFSRDRRRYIAARSRLREILGGILGDAPEAIRFKYSIHGKPSLWGQAGASRRLCFNVSHSGDLALVAVAWDLDLGVDLEMKQPDLSMVNSVQGFLHAREKDWLSSHAEQNRLEAFYRVWTLKEAVAKATGLGLGAKGPFVWVRPGADGVASVLEGVSDQNLTAWRALNFIPRPGYQAALAYRQDNTEDFKLDFVGSDYNNTRGGSVEKTAYVFHELDKAFGEGRRLTAQAQAFVDIELSGVLAKIRPGSKIADFGCGTGVISTALAQSLESSTVVGVDLDEKALDMARENGKGLPNLSFERYGFGEEILPAAAPFDVAFTRLVLLHLPDPVAAIAEMGRCLKPGGLLYLADCDDDFIDFSPKQDWQGELILLMKQAQALRGGTRTLGSRLLRMLSEGGFWPEGGQVHYYSTETLGMERWREIFVPAMGNMAQRDLQFLVERGSLDSGKPSEMKRKMEDFFSMPACRAQLSTWHAWARKV
jgi:4'-phosphopantetheinyl transferase